MRCFPFKSQLRCNGLNIKEWQNFCPVFSITARLWWEIKKTPANGKNSAKANKTQRKQKENNPKLNGSDNNVREQRWNLQANSMI